MELDEERIFGALILLAGVTFLAVGLYSGQLAKALEIISRALSSAIAG